MLLQPKIIAAKKRLLHRARARASARKTGSKGLMLCGHAGDIVKCEPKKCLREENACRHCERN